MMYHSRSRTSKELAPLNFSTTHVRLVDPTSRLFLSAFQARTRKIPPIIGVDSLHCSSALHFLIIPLNSHSN
jgi:hypothetical protein